MQRVVQYGRNTCPYPVLLGAEPVCTHQMYHDFGRCLGKLRSMPSRWHLTRDAHVYVFRYLVPGVYLLAFVFFVIPYRHI